MAVRSDKTGVRNRVAYEVLNNISSVDLLYDERKKQRTVGIYQAERLIARRKDREGWKYFVKWAGYSSFDNTWEPQGHLSPALLRYFEKPDPSQDVVLDCMDSLRREILSCLKRKDLNNEFL
ncbi:Hypothetical predicted protein [Paramuricea clavata]|uniref:Uncharacterized protein n=1 Tax=Paramuricea clavata TaxID=317549 RepID=A0A6S7HUZ8_PARCT|nr:Hypothetical predicted protein [Paramuricea clavata]